MILYELYYGDYDEFISKGLYTDRKVAESFAELLNLEVRMRQIDVPPLDEDYIDFLETSGLRVFGVHMEKWGPEVAYEVEREQITSEFPAHNFVFCDLIEFNGGNIVKVNGHVWALNEDEALTTLKNLIERYGITEEWTHEEDL